MVTSKTLSRPSFSINVNSWLKKASSSIDRLDAELILASIFDKDRTFLHAHADEELTAEQQKVVDDMLLRRQKHEPLAYILGYKEFYGHKFYLTRDVLIPRPEAEALVDSASELYQKLSTNAVKPAKTTGTAKAVQTIQSGEPIKILDLGTGSGCIALSLASKLSQSAKNHAEPEANIQIVASDISAKALACAEYNAQKLQIKSISWVKSNLLKSKAFKNQTFDIIVANLPYVDKAWPWIDKNTLKYEPKLALYASNYGLGLIKNLIDKAPKHLKKGCFFVLEADICQHQAILDYAAEKNKLQEYVPVVSNDAQNLGQTRQSLALVLQYR